MGSAEKHDFHGVVVRRDPDGYGLVKLDGPPKAPLAFFTGEVLQNPVIEHSCKVGQKVLVRTIEQNGGYRVIRLDLDLAKAG